MVVRRLPALVAASVLALSPVHALAWGYVGHKMIAAIAWKYMTPAAQDRAKWLLSQDTDTLTPPDFISRATWADAYRNDHKETSAWHYIDIPFAAAKDIDSAEGAEPALCPHPTLPGQSAAIGAPPDDCVVDKIKQFEAELKDPATPVQEQILALKFLMHFVGDVHQPLHAIDDNDKGGNCVWVSVDGKAQRLHAYWDTAVVLQVLGDRTPEAFAADEKANHIPSDAVGEWSDDDPALWAAESAKMAHYEAYSLGVDPLPTCATENAQAPIDVTGAIVPPAMVQTQLEKAGVRLAYVLNHVLPH